MTDGSKNFKHMPTVKFDPTRVTDSVRADLRDNIETLSDIAPSNYQKVYEAALRAILVGGDLHSLSKVLIGLGMTPARAGEVARHLDFNATALMEAERREKLGITHAIWRYSGAPCGGAAQDTAHRAADGRRFPVTEGLQLNGRFTLPGRELGCKCVSTIVLPGFEDDDDPESQARANAENARIQAEWLKKHGK